MRHPTHPRNVARALALAGLASVAFTACAKSASDCALLGLPDGCGGGSATTTTTTTTSSSTNTGGSTTTTSSTTTTASTTSMGGGGTGGGGTGGSTTSSNSGGTGGVAPVTEFLPACLREVWGSTNDQAVRGVVAGTLGATIAGDFQDTINLGTGPATAAASGSMFVAQLGASLAPTWVKTFDAHFTAIAAGKAGHVILAGQLVVPTNFGCGMLDPLNGGFFLVELDQAGACAYARNFSANMTHTSLAADTNGNAVLAGGVTGTATFGTTTITSQGGEDIVLATFDNTGAPVTVRTFGGASDERAVSVAVDSSGLVYATGTFEGILDFASGDGVFNAAGHIGAFVASFTTSLGPDWSKHMKSANDVLATAVVALPSGGVAAGGSFTGAVDPEGSMLTSMNGGFYVARYSAVGTPATHTLVDGLAAGDVSAMAADFAGTIALAGSTSKGLYLAAIDPDGVITYQGNATGGGSHHRAAGAAFVASDNLVLGGFFDGTLATTSPNVVSSAGGDDAFVIKVCSTP